MMLAVFFWDKLAERLTNHLGCRISEEIFGGAIEQGDIMLLIDSDYRIIGGVDDRSKTGRWSLPTHALKSFFA